MWEATSYINIPIPYKSIERERASVDVEQCLETQVCPLMYQTRYGVCHLVLDLTSLHVASMRRWAVSSLGWKQSQAASKTAASAAISREYRLRRAVRYRSNQHGRRAGGQCSTQTFIEGTQLRYIAFIYMDLFLENKKSLGVQVSQKQANSRKEKQTNGLDLQACSRSWKCKLIC